MKILIVEDDPETAGFLVRGLREAGYSVDVARDGIEGLDFANCGHYDGLIVDRLLPRLDGLLMVETLRKSGDQTPVMFVSALGEVEERVKGLRGGGDDYLVKPYAFIELLARLEALLRRRAQWAPPPAQLRVGDLEMDLASRTVKRGGAVVSLQPREFRLLEYLMRHAGQVLTRTMLLEAVWDYRFDPQTNVIDVHISRLRQKLEGSADKPLIRTVRGAGYMLRAGE
jgi:two-component system, OmpR family, response regulator